MFSFTFLSHYYHSLSPFTLIFAYINTRASPKHPLSLSLSLSRKGPQGFYQRALCTWVRNALEKGTESRKKGIRKLNTDVVHAGDIQHDAMVFTERFKETSTEWATFRDLYGMTLKEWKTSVC